MKRRILALVLSVALGSTFLCPSISARANEMDEVSGEQKKSLIYETDTITQYDYEEGFHNYAHPEATVDFVSELRSLSERELANVVGVVKDYNTDEMISGAVISANGDKVVVTGEDGRFQIKNIPSGTYDWQINVNEYAVANYNNYDVDSADGTTIFTFYVNRDKEVVRDREEIVHDDEDGQTVPPDTISMGNYMISANAKSMNSIPSVSDTVKVYYNDKTQSVNREEYIYTVLSSELYGTSYYEDKGLTSSQVSQLYKAQAIAANTFLEYAMSVYSNHSSYDVCSGTCCQVFDPAKVTEAAIDATADIFITQSSGKTVTKVVLYKPETSKYDYIWGAFFSSCKGNGTKKHSTQPALQAVSCTDIATGAGGHRYGLCQMGAAQRAKDGKTASSILLYYYTGCTVENCTLK